MKLFAVLGNPIAHSLSPLMHNNANAVLGNEGVYTRIKVERCDDLRACFEANNLHGANITVPCKEMAFAQSDQVCGIAQQIGAVNAWVVVNGKLLGYNTDAPGFMESIAHIGKPNNTLILGAGGTARAIAIAFKQAGYRFTVLNRSCDRLDFFARAGIKTAQWHNMPQEDFDLIINTTSAGLIGDDLPLEAEALSGYLSSAVYAVDVIYGKKTPFLQLAEELGIKTQDGLQMLIAQGAHAYELFFPNSDRAAVAAAMRQALSLPKEIQWH
ncbi:MAG: shikimate dehydrogenase [Helicobacteraceae bacterium]|jgi:shikimate dehydrogenase|nr:shikimate dehydrogenase [Helicobacteraceae bacterium]